MNKNTICLWYNHDAEEAARFYARTFPNSTVGAVHRAPSDYPNGKAGDVLFGPLRKALGDYATLSFVQRLTIVPAQMGTDAGLVGAAAAALAKQDTAAAV